MPGGRRAAAQKRTCDLGSRQYPFLDQPIGEAEHQIAVGLNDGLRTLKQPTQFDIHSGERLWREIAQSRREHQTVSKPLPFMGSQEEIGGAGQIALGPGIGPCPENEVGSPTTQRDCRDIQQALPCRHNRWQLGPGPPPEDPSGMMETLSTV